MPKLKASYRGRDFQVEYTGTDNVMIALYDDVDWGTCGGSCACASCICTVLEGEEYFKEPSEEEMDLLLAEGRPNARLGCQLDLDKAPDGKVKIRI